MGKRKITKPGSPYKGFRMGMPPRFSVNFRDWEKAEVLTSLHHQIVQEALDRCTITRKVMKPNRKGTKEKEVEEVVIIVTPCYVARLIALLEKPFNEAKVDQLGNPWEKPKELTQEEIDKLNRDAVDTKNKTVVVDDDAVAEKIKHTVKKND